MSVRLTVLLVFLLSLSACGPDITYQDSKEIGAAGWSYADSVSFEFPVTDTTDRYDLVLSVTHGADFPYQNFYTRISTHLPDGTVLTQPLSLQLSDKFGAWFGDCSGGSCTTDISLQEGAKFTELGDHRLVVAQYSREDPLPNVTGLAFRIVRVPE